MTNISLAAATPQIMILAPRTVIPSGVFFTTRRNMSGSFCFDGESLRWPLGSVSAPATEMSRSWAESTHFLSLWW